MNKHITISAPTSGFTTLFNFISVAKRIKRINCMFFRHASLSLVSDRHIQASQCCVVLISSALEGVMLYPRPIKHEIFIAAPIAHAQWGDIHVSLQSKLCKADCVRVQ